MTTTTNLIERLRTWKAPFCIPVEGHPMLEAADLLEAQAKQIEELNLKLISSFGETQNALDRIEALQADAELGRIAMRFVDRAGDVADCDPAERICAEFYKAMGDAVTAAQQDEDDGCPDCKVWMAQKDWLLKSHNLNGDLRIKAEEELAALKADQPLTKEQVEKVLALLRHYRCVMIAADCDEAIEIMKGVRG